MNSSTKSPGNPPVYEQLRIPVMVNTEPAEIGFIRRLVAAHLLKVKSGNITDEGRKALLKLYNDLNELEHLLKE